MKSGRAGRRPLSRPPSGHLGEFEQLVLFAVLRLTEASGTAVRVEIEGRTGRAAAVGAVYTTLGRLETRGLVRSEQRRSVPHRAGRPRKHYTLRPAGARALLRAYSGLQALANGVVAKLTTIAND